MHKYTVNIQYFCIKLKQNKSSELIKNMLE